MKPHARTWKDLQQPRAHYLNRDWKYQQAASHADSAQFRKRMEQYRQREQLKDLFKPGVF